MPRSQPSTLSGDSTNGLTALPTYPPAARTDDDDNSSYRAYTSRPNSTSSRGSTVRRSTSHRSRSRPSSSRISESPVSELSTPDSALHRPYSPSLHAFVPITQRSRTPWEYRSDLEQPAPTFDDIGIQRNSVGRYSDNNSASSFRSGSEVNGGDAAQPPNKLRLAAAVSGACLATFLKGLDTTIVSTAIPQITNDFCSLEDQGWYGSAFLLTTCAFQLFFGKMYAFFSTKWVFVTALLIFEVGSVICGAAPNSIAFIFGRAIAGLGAAGIFSGAYLMVAEVVPPNQRALYTGLLGAVYTLSSVVGPVIGGAFTSNGSATWRWCFYVNLPIGGLNFLFVAFFNSPTTASKLQAPLREKISQLDLVGLTLFVPAMVCLLLALQLGGSKYPWSDWRIILLLTLFGLLIFGFLLIQMWLQDAATVPPRIVAIRIVAASSFFTFAYSASFVTLNYYLYVYRSKRGFRLLVRTLHLLCLLTLYSQIWFQAVQGVSALDSGVHNLPLLVAALILIFGSAVLVNRLLYLTPFMMLSSVFLSVGCGVLATLKPDSGINEWLGYQVIAGIGIGLGSQQPMNAIQSVLPMPDIPVGIAVIAFFQALGPAVFLSVGQNLFLNNLTRNVMTYASGVDPDLVANGGDTTLSSIVPPDQVGNVRLATNDAIQQVFYLTAGLAAMTILGCFGMGLKARIADKMKPTHEEDGKKESEWESTDDDNDDDDNEQTNKKK